MSFLEMLDVVNEGLFDGARTRSRSTRTAEHLRNVQPRRQRRAARTGSRHDYCQLHAPFQGRRRLIECGGQSLRSSRISSRSGAFDRIIAAGGFVSVNAGGAPDGHHSIPKDVSEAAMDSAACIGCGLRGGVQERVGAPVHERQDLSPCAAAQGGVERYRRRHHDRAGRRGGFGSCSNEANAKRSPRRFPSQHRAHDAGYIKAT